MFYKILKNDRVVDVLDKLVYMKWQEKHKIMVLCSENEAQGILSSDGEQVWHEPSLYEFPSECEGKYSSVDIEKIDEFEYKSLKALNGKTPEDIFDEAVMLLLERGL